jgi:DNA-binding transcriptional LysR family regulator
MTTNSAGMMLGLALGSACGAVPLALGAYRDRLLGGLIGFIAAAVAGAGWGVVPALLVAALMTGVILLPKPTWTGGPVGRPAARPPGDDANRDAARGGQPDIAEDRGSPAPRRPAGPWR